MGKRSLQAHPGLLFGAGRPTRSSRYAHPEGVAACVVVADAALRQPSLGLQGRLMGQLGSVAEVAGGQATDGLGHLGQQVACNGSQIFIVI